MSFPTSQNLKNTRLDASSKHQNKKNSQIWDKSWTWTLAIFLQCVSANFCIDLYPLSPLIDENTTAALHIRSPISGTVPSPCRHTKQRTPVTLRKLSGCSTTSADIRFRNGKWMVSQDLNNNPYMLVHFPPLQEVGTQEFIDDTNSEVGRIEESMGRSRDEMQKQEDEDSSLGGSSMMTPAENDFEEEWYPL